MKSKLFLLCGILMVLGASTSTIHSAFIVSPTAPSQGDGTGAPLFPAAPSFRYQDLRPASDFTSLMSPLLITEFSLGRHPLSLPIDLTLPNVEIHFSTTPRTPSQISTFFAENIGPDDTTVFSGPLRLVDMGGEYGISIALQTPFLYDPSQGNLLMDIRNYEAIPTPSNGRYLVNYATGPFPTLWFTAGPDVTSVRGTTASNGGLFSRFTVTPVPEPSTWLLLATGVAALAMARRKWNRTR